MNFGFYGHANTLVFTYTKDGKFSKQAQPGGMGQIHLCAQRAVDGKTLNMNMDDNDADANSNEYRRDYYGLRYDKAARKEVRLTLDRYLGYEDGTTHGNIYSVMPSDPNVPADILFVWDEGYGGLEIPDGKHIFWASDKALPDKEQFGKIADKCFLFLEGNVVRKAGAMISRQISWERTATELISEIQNNPAISYLLNARYLLISFGLDGAVFIIPKNKDGQLEASLILTHGEIEGTLSSKHPGRVADVIIFNYTATIFFTMVAGLAEISASGLSENIPPWKPDNIFVELLNTLANVLSRDVRNLSKIIEHSESDTVRWGGILRTLLDNGEFIASLTLFNEPDDVEEVDVKHGVIRDWPAFSIPLVQKGDMLQVPYGWTIINSVGNRQLSDVAFDYVQNGAGAIAGLPQFSLGAFTTIDRWEIESYQNIRNLIMGYVNGDSPRPLSIAVFGSPGSGKSFGVTQIAQNMLPGKIEKLEFNVSQFTALSDLGVAFQKVRDTILSGKLPLVFFDEFDSDYDGRALGWIKNFLMPMQDGKFRDDSGEHPLGKCILVFAGGTASSFEDFIAPPKNGICVTPVVKLREDRAVISAENRKQVAEEMREAQNWNQNFKNIKGPDFISRLRGTINVLGPNLVNDDDKNYIIRRALLLRSLCERKLKFNENTAPVSEKIIHAMLHVPEYKHGARSMEAILDMSRIDGNSWEPVSLPSRSQLSLHVDADAFIKLVLVGEHKGSPPKGAVPNG